MASCFDIFPPLQLPPPPSSDVIKAAIQSWTLLNLSVFASQFQILLKRHPGHVTEGKDMLYRAKNIINIQSFVTQALYPHLLPAWISSCSLFFQRIFLSHRNHITNHWICQNWASLKWSFTHLHAAHSSLHISVSFLSPI